MAQQHLEQFLTNRRLLFSEWRSPRAASFVLSAERTRPGFFPGPVLELVAGYTADATDAWELCLDSAPAVAAAATATSPTDPQAARMLDEEGFHFRSRTVPEIRIWPMTSARGYFHAEVAGLISYCVVWCNGVVDASDEHDPDEYIETARIPVRWLPSPPLLPSRAECVAPSSSATTVVAAKSHTASNKQQQIPTAHPDSTDTETGTGNEATETHARERSVAAHTGFFVVERCGDALRFIARGANEEEDAECLMLLPDGTATYLGEDWVVTISKSGVHSTAVPKEVVRRARSRSGSGSGSGSGSDTASKPVDPSAA